MRLGLAGAVAIENMEQLARGQGLDKSASVSCDEALAWEAHRKAPVNPALRPTVLAQWSSSGPAGMFADAVCTQ